VRNVRSGPVKSNDVDFMMDISDEISGVAAEIGVGAHARM